jgi:hypothetical protein
MSVGLWAAWTARITCAVVAYHFFLSETFFHHNRAFLLIYLAGLSLIPSGDSVSIDALRRGGPEPQRPLWPLWLWRAEACVPYLASATSKVLDPDWFAGVVTWDRLQRFRYAGEPFVPQFLLDLLSQPEFHSVFAKLTIALELAIGLGLPFVRTRYLAAWLAVVFHFSIEVSARVEVFSLLGMSGLLIWATPRTRDRVLLLGTDTTPRMRLARLIRALDWLARFDIQEQRAGGPALSLRERDGSQWSGRRALVRVFSRLPLTAFFALPWLVWDLFRETPPERELEPSQLVSE